jgi:hypothetical protein
MDAYVTHEKNRWPLVAQDVPMSTIARRVGRPFDGQFRSTRSLGLQEAIRQLANYFVASLSHVVAISGARFSNGVRYSSCRKLRINLRRSGDVLDAELWCTRPTNVPRRRGALAADKSPKHTATGADWALKGSERKHVRGWYAHLLGRTGLIAPSCGFHFAYLKREAHEARPIPSPAHGRGVTVDK